MTYLPDHRTGETVSLNRAHAPAAQEGPEDEGGPIADPGSLAITPTDVSLPAPDRTIASEELRAMRAKFEADFAHGLMGQHHNTFQHRSRVLHRLSEASGD